MGVFLVTLKCVSSISSNVRVFLHFSHADLKSSDRMPESSFSLIGGRSPDVRILPKPASSSELSHQKSPRLNGPLVLSSEKCWPRPRSSDLFSAASSKSKIHFMASDAVSVVATASPTPISHCVRTRAISNRTVTTR